MSNELLIAIIGLGGVVVGGIIASTTTFISEFWKHKKEKAHFKYTKFYELQVSILLDVMNGFSNLNRKFFTYHNLWIAQAGSLKNLNHDRDQLQELNELIDSLNDLSVSFNSRKFFIEEDLYNMISELFTHFSFFIRVMNDIYYQKYPFDLQPFAEITFTLETMQENYDHSLDLVGQLYMLEVPAIEKRLQIKVKDFINHQER